MSSDSGSAPAAMKQTYPSHSGFQFDPSVSPQVPPSNLMPCQYCLSYLSHRDKCQFNIKHSMCRACLQPQQILSLWCRVTIRPQK